MNSEDSLDLRATYVQLHDGASAVAIPGGDEFWQTIDTRTELHEGRLVVVSPMTETWSHWEMHPAGEELVVALSGEYEFVFADFSGERRIALVAGRAAIVPRGVWHRAVVHAAGEMLFVTRGAGTQHKPFEEPRV